MTIRKYRACEECNNTFRERITDYSTGKVTLTCTNCGDVRSGKTKKKITAWMITAESDSFLDDMLVLTHSGWMTFPEAKKQGVRTYIRRQTQSIKYEIQNPPYRYTVKVTDISS